MRFSWMLFGALALTALATSVSAHPLLVEGCGTATTWVAEWEPFDPSQPNDDEIRPDEELHRVNAVGRIPPPACFIRS